MTEYCYQTCSFFFFFFNLEISGFIPFLLSSIQTYPSFQENEVWTNRFQYSLLALIGLIIKFELLRLENREGN